MRATLMHGQHDVRVEDVPDASLKEPGDALVRVVRACICGSDLWPYNGGPNYAGQRMGHEAIGMVEAVGSDVRTLKKGDLVVMPFASSDGTCAFCQEGLPTACKSVHLIGNTRASTAPRPRRCACPRRTAPCSPSLWARTTR